MNEQCPECGAKREDDCFGNLAFACGSPGIAYLDHGRPVFVLICQSAACKAAASRHGEGGGTQEERNMSTDHAALAANRYPALAALCDEHQVVDSVAHVRAEAYVAIGEIGALQQQLADAATAVYMPPGYQGTLAEYLAAEVWPTPRTEDVETIQRLGRCLRRMLDPEDLGYAVSAWVRDAVREALGKRRCETIHQQQSEATDGN
jgi:hypothetical protein